jgi:hypothetical protein
MTTIEGARPWDRTSPDYGHFGVLLSMLGGRAPDETEQLAYCHQRVVGEGARSSSGLWCVCLSEDAPRLAENRRGGGMDGMASLICVKRDLESAADGLPIGWKSTERIFKAQHRTSTYGARLTYLLRNLRVREIDRWQEPRDPETGRLRSASLTHYLMSLSLGGARTECRWPRVQPVTLIEQMGRLAA